jgi:WhiB family redox-sensing transcriptional regulator
MENKWRQGAACIGMPIEMFYQPKKTPKVVKETCNGCPVKEECLDYALRYEPCGYFGGETAEDRKLIRRQRKIKFTPLNGDGRNLPYKHGDIRTYQYEIRQGQKPCDICRQAWSSYNSTRYTARGLRQGRVAKMPAPATKRVNTYPDMGEN